MLESEIYIREKENINYNKIIIKTIELNVEKTHLFITAILTNKKGQIKEIKKQIKLEEITKEINSIKEKFISKILYEEQDKNNNC